MTKPASITDGSVFELATIGRELRTDDAYQRDGHTARTLVREPMLRVVLVVMKASARIAEHRAQEITTVHALTGSLRLTVADRTVELTPGRLLVIPPDLRHDVAALTDSALLLTLAWCERR
ncbi:MAG TPA: cupin domain-containing protein [Kofleriaceae bacterium]|nr:cupin domain-containing protein [Kofleriaceae bacterium]